MTRVLVTGGLGFIGSFTVDMLVHRGYRVRIIDTLERQVHHGSMPTYRNPNAEFMRVDVRSNPGILKAIQDVDYIIHLAAVVGVGQSFWQPRRYIDVNVKGTATIFECLIRNPQLRQKIKKIVVASSKSIYGEGSYRCRAHGVLNPPPRPVEQLARKEWEVKCPQCGEVLEPVGIKEDKVPQNLSPYALSKYATEALAMAYSKALGIPTVVFRYFNVYGPRQSLSNPYTGVVAIFLTRLKNGKPPIVFEDGMQMRDYVYVEDVAKLNVEALENDAEGAFNLGTGEPHTLLEVIDSLKKILGSNVQPKITNDYRPGDNRHDFADNSKLLKHFKIGRFTRLSEGLEKLVDWSRTIRAVDMLERAERERLTYLGRGNAKESSCG